MKKIYQKPGMYIEDYSMTQSIAVDCGADRNSTIGRPNHANKETCGWYMGNLVVWNVGVGSGACTFDGGEEFGGFCYNNPNGNNVIFNS